jgi:hypothetical protein
MDYSKLLKRAWDITWNNKYLWVLGFLAGLGQAGSSSSFRNGWSSSPSTGGRPTLPEMPDFSRFWQENMALIIGLTCLLFIIGLALWLLRLTAQGGLIAAVKQLEGGEKSSLGHSFTAGVNYLPRLAGLSILVSLPALVIGLLIFALFFGFVGMSALEAMSQSGDIEAMWSSFGLFFLCFIPLMCLAVPLTIILGIWEQAAQRGIVLHELGVMDGLREGWGMLRSHLTEVIVIGFILIVLGILFGFAVTIVVLPCALILVVPMLGTIFTGAGLDMVSVGLLILGGLVIGLIAAAVSSIFTTFQSATITLAYQDLSSGIKYDPVKLRGKI